MQDIGTPGPTYHLPGLLLKMLSAQSIHFLFVHGLNLFNNFFLEILKPLVIVYMAYKKMDFILKERKKHLFRGLNSKNIQFGAVADIYMPKSKIKLSKLKT